MQLKKNLFNLSDESKQNNSKFDNNSPNAINFHNSPNNIDISNKENSKEKENCIADIGPSMKEIKNEEGIKKLDVDNYYIHSPHNNLFYMNNSNNSIPKIDRYFNNNLIDADSNMQDIENNNNANDENFFNYSFYNNKNNNKIVNNNYINKLNENNEIKNNTNDQLPKYNQNFFQTNNNKNPQSQIEQPIPNFHNIQNIESYHNNSNKRNSFFSTENSNSNFRKKTKHKKQFKVRFGDWICPKCENLNFSFRNKCNRCGLSKEKTEHYNNNSLQNRENNLNEHRPIMFNNININYIFNSNYPLNNINIVYNPILFNTNNINNYYGNYNNYHIYYPCNVNIK